MRGRWPRYATACMGRLHVPADLTMASSRGFASDPHRVPSPPLPRHSQPPPRFPGLVSLLGQFFARLVPFGSFPRFETSCSVRQVTCCHSSETNLSDSLSSNFSPFIFPSLSVARNEPSSYRCFGSGGRSGRRTSTPRGGVSCLRPCTILFNVSLSRDHVVLDLRLHG